MPLVYLRTHAQLNIISPLQFVVGFSVAQTCKRFRSHSEVIQFQFFSCTSEFYDNAAIYDWRKCIDTFCASSTVLRCLQKHCDCIWDLASLSEELTVAVVTVTGWPVYIVSLEALQVLIVTQIPFTNFFFNNSSCDKDVSAH